MPDPALGIPDMENYGSPLAGLRAGDLVKYVLQHHSTVRRPSRPHYDLRLGTPATGLYSWAVPKAVMPEPGQKVLAPQTQVHAYAYGDFEGKIGKGYGAGNVVMAGNGKALITRSGQNSLSFTLADSRTPVRYQLIRVSKPSVTGKADWLLMGRRVGEGAAGVGFKPKLRLLKDRDLDKALAAATSVQAKIDGAHTVYDVGERGDLEAYGVNRSVTGKPIVHSERLGVAGMKLPELANTTFRGEAFAKDQKGKAIPFNELSGILNSAIAKARETQLSRGISMVNAPFAVERLRGEPVTDQAQALAELAAHLPTPAFEMPETVVGKEKALDLLARIRAGKQPQTSEGVIVNTPTQKLKYKIRPELTGFIRGTYPAVAEGKRSQTAGGILASTTPDGEANVRVGTGFTDAELSDIVSSINELKGKPIRIGYQNRFSSGRLRAPSYLGMEVE